MRVRRNTGSTTSLGREWPPGPRGSQGENITEDDGWTRWAGKDRAVTEGPWILKAASPQPHHLILHIPGGDLPLFLCPFLGVPAATWPSGAQQHLVQVSK